jgi:hypothetical protein
MLKKIKVDGPQGDSLKTFEERKLYAEHVTANMESGKPLSFKCIECGELVGKEAVPKERLLSNGLADFYIRWFSLCDSCRRKWEIERLKLLPEVLRIIVGCLS